MEMETGAKPASDIPSKYQIESNLFTCKSFFSASLVIAFAAIDVNIPGDFNQLLMMKEIPSLTAHPKLFLTKSHSLKICSKALR